MRKQAFLALNVVLILSAFVRMANASEETFADSFLGSPLLVLAVILIIDAVAVVYYRIRK